MPRFIGSDIHDAVEVEKQDVAGMVCVTYSQAALLARVYPVSKVLNTSDRGGRGRKAKRWYNWYVRPEAIEKSSCATDAMRRRLERFFARPEEKCN